MIVIMCLAFSLVESKFILPAHFTHMKFKSQGNLRVSLGALKKISTIVFNTLFTTVTATSSSAYPVPTAVTASRALSPTLRFLSTFAVQHRCSGESRNAAGDELASTWPSWPMVVMPTPRTGWPRAGTGAAASRSPTRCTGARRRLAGRNSMLAGGRPLVPRQPVVHLSYYEPMPTPAGPAHACPPRPNGRRPQAGRNPGGILPTLACSTRSRRRRRAQGCGRCLATCGNGLSPATRHTPALPQRRARWVQDDQRPHRQEYPAHWPDQPQSLRAMPELAACCAS